MKSTIKDGNESNFSMIELIERVESKMLSEGVAETITKQMGGTGRLKAMIGARNFMSDNGGKTLQFDFPNKGTMKPNRLRVTLNGKDLYDVEFGRVMKKQGVPTYKKIKKIDDIYAEDLIGLFERTTGLYLRM